MVRSKTVAVFRESKYLEVDAQPLFFEDGSFQSLNLLS